MNPLNPGTPSYIDTTVYSKGVFVSGDYAYVADVGSGLAIIDISNIFNEIAAYNLNRTIVLVGLVLSAVIGVTFSVITANKKREKNEIVQTKSLREIFSSPAIKGVIIGAILSAIFGTISGIMDFGGPIGGYLIDVAGFISGGIYGGIIAAVIGRVWLFIKKNQFQQPVNRQITLKAHNSCGKCGAQMSEDTVYCTNCGAKSQTPI